MLRRKFLTSSVQSMALIPAIAGFSLLPSGVRAANIGPTLTNKLVVNITMAGGPDFRHLLPPAFNSDPQSYGYKQWLAKAPAHDISRTETDVQGRWDQDYFHMSDGNTEFGILKSCSYLKKLWDEGKVAIINNVVGASTRDHAHCQLVLDQGNLNSGPNDYDQSGWGGRLASAMSGNIVSMTHSPRRFCYADAVDGGSGYSTENLVSIRNSRDLKLFTPDSSEPDLAARPVMSRALQAYYSHLPIEEMNSLYSAPAEHFHSISSRSADLENRISQYYNIFMYLWAQGSLVSSQYYGTQFRNLFDCINAHDILNMKVASMEVGSWDSHANQKALIEPKLEDFFGFQKTLEIFYMEASEDVKENTVFVLAGEFGRQLSANGANGTDHGKGNSMLVIGNGVQGGIYGDMFPLNELQRLDVPSADIEGLTDIDQIFRKISDWATNGSGASVIPPRVGEQIESGFDINSLFI